MTQPKRDNAASVKQRLLNLAHVLDEEFEQVLVRYVAERFLFRLSKSYHADSFLLKGAMLFVAWEGLPHRVTRDVDLLGLGEPSVDRVAGMMRDIALQPVEDDGIKFDIASVEAEEIRTAQDYGGVRVTVNAMLGKARIRLQVDVGFGDAVTPEAQIVEFPSLLGHMPAMLRAYPPETVIAEKALVIIERGLVNSRIKDYFDILHLARTRAFTGNTLVRALTATADRRRVPIVAGNVAGLSTEFAADLSKQAQWRGLCARLRAGAQQDSLSDVVASLATFLGPIIAAVARRERGIGSWPPGGPWR
jgi:predicted nucleotidyltransferase component of viral defense system